MLKHLVLAAALAIPTAAMAKDKGHKDKGHKEDHADEGKGEASIKRWVKHHKQAADELEDWIKANEEASKLMFEWEATHPKASKKWVHWAIEHKDGSLEDFEKTHAATEKKKEPAWWVSFDKLMNDHKSAAEGFMAWARKHPKAAESLMKHHKGLHWASTHVKQAEKDMAGPESKPEEQKKGE